MTLSDKRYPKLRNIDLRHVIHNGRPSILLRDPMQLTDKMLIVPQELLPLLALCDGTRENASAVAASMAVRHGLQVPPSAVEQLLAALDEALLLDNDAFRQAHERVLTEYRQAPFRPPIHAGQSYPADPNELRSTLQYYIDGAPNESNLSPDGFGSRGLVSPHIDYRRGGPVYARVWKYVAASVRAADLVVILGTDHAGGEGRITLTRQNYATPFGVLPTARPVVDALAEAIGEQAAFAEELHHRTEHSVELAAVWLHFVRGGEPCEVVPVLCGSFGRYVQDGVKPEDDSAIRGLLDAFQVTAGRRVVIVAAGDLSHVGPEFGGDPLDWAGRARLQAADDELMERMCDGDAEGFLAAIRRVQDRNNVCGLPPIYLAMRLLGSVRGERIAYEHCPADEQNTSTVSVCGVVFS
jgi:AmmeMemoRadiSam system protein B